MQEDLNIEQKINKKAETWWDNITKFFDSIEFLELEKEKKQEVAMNVKKDALWDKLYWIEIFLSWIIASLWLLQNSVAVVIWAMLIAPLLRPINGISFSIARWEKSFFWDSINVLFVSSLFAIITWFIVQKIIWLDVANTEILSRTSPNIIDLFIAIFSAIVAVLSLWFVRLWESIAWVAMAAALLPPLSVVWIEFAMWNYILAWWAFTLYLANLVAIIFIGIIVFWLYWFTPHTWDKQKSVVKRFWFVVIVILIISIPLIHSLFIIKEKKNIHIESKNYLENLLKQETDQFSIAELEVKSITKDNISLFAIIKIPEWLKFYDTFKKQLDFEFSKKFWKNVELEIELIRTANIISSEKIINIENQMYSFLVDIFWEKFSNTNVISIEIKQKSLKYFIKIILWVKEELSINKNTFIEIENKFREKFNKQVEFSFIPLIEYKSKEKDIITKEQSRKTILKNSIEWYINNNITSNIKVRKIDYDIDLLNNKTIIDIYLDFNLEYKKEFVDFADKINKFKEENFWNIILNINYDIFKKYKNLNIKNK